MHAIDPIDRCTERVHELIAQLQFVIDWCDERGLLDDHSFTFPDGEEWAATNRRPPDTR